PRPRREREARGLPRRTREGGRGPREGRRDAGEGPVDQGREAGRGPGGARPPETAEPFRPRRPLGREEARGVGRRGAEGAVRERQGGDRSMKAVVLAGGEGTRLKPLTYKRPKPLMPVAGRPCIDYVLRSLAGSGFHEIIVTTAYMSDALIKSIGDGLDYHASILYSFKEKPKKEEAFSNLVNAGIYVLEPEVLEFVPPDQKFDFAKDLFPKLLSKGLGLFGSKIDGVWMDIGQPHDLWKASMAIVSREGR